MVDFSESFKKGIEAAKSAENNRNEIASVFQSLNEDIAKETEGKVGIKIQTLQAKTGIPIFDFFNPSTGYQAIVAYNPQVPQSPVRELAEWSQDRAGYPCKIKFGLKEIYCEDKESLKAGLAELLEDPIIGEKLYRLTQLKLNEDPAIDSESDEEKEDGQAGNTP